MIRFLIAGTTVTAEAGRPELPVVGILIGVPAEAELEIEIVLDDKQTVDGAYHLTPSRRAAADPG